MFVLFDTMIFIYKTVQDIILKIRTFVAKNMSLILKLEIIFPHHYLIYLLLEQIRDILHRQPIIVYLVEEFPQLIAEQGNTLTKTMYIITKLHWCLKICQK